MEKPEIPQKSPYGVTVEPGTYRWCSCGLAQTQPFCDDAHIGTDYQPVIVTFEKEETVWFCGCKHTGSPPFCDGTHKTI